ncbi:hypothetical protein Tco_1040376, partial [Tanacetum coccineum]
MSYPRFTKIIIDYFMSKDQSILRKNKMFWHTARDDTMFTSMRCISRHEDTQVYGIILPKELTNQEILESNSYKTYYTFASREKAPKLKYIRKKADPDTLPKQKPVQATKGTRIKSKAKVALTKVEQLKLATKRSKTQFYSSHVSGLGDGDDTQSKVPDEQQQKTSGTYEGTDDEKDSDDISDEGDDDNDGNNGNDGDDDDANDDANDEDKQEGDDTNDDDEETNNDRTKSDRIKIPILDQSTTEYYKEEEEKIDDEETMDEEKDDEVTKELYDDVNVNLGNENTEMT